jgi:microcystin degradation protein MlrC
VRRIILAGLYHETNTFVAEMTGADRFTFLHGDEILACAGDGSPIDGFLQVATEEGWAVIPAVSCGATPSGRVADEIFETFWGALAGGRSKERHRPGSMRSSSPSTARW